VTALKQRTGAREIRNSIEQRFRRSASRETNHITLAGGDGVRFSGRVGRSWARSQRLEAEAGRAPARAR
jgi:hypothetical protein